MTIFNSGYSTLSYEPVAPLWRLWPLARMEFTKIFRSKKGLLVFLACIAFLIVKAVILWAYLGPESQQLGRGMSMMENFSRGMSPFRREFYLNHSTDWGFLPFLLLTSLVGVRSIAGDKAVNALEILWTRGITPWGYFVGKWAGSLLLLAAAFFAGPLILWLYGMLTAPDGLYWEKTIEFMPQVLLALLLKCVVLSFLAVGFSALSSSTRVANFLWLLMILGTEALGQILTVISRAVRRSEDVLDPPWYRAICPWEAMKRIEENIAGVARPSDYAVWIACASLGILVLFLVYRLRGQMRTVEAVA